MDWLKAISADGPAYLAPFTIAAAALVILLFASLAHRSLVSKVFSCFVALTGIAGLVWLHLDLRDVRQEYLSDLVRFEDRLYAEHTGLNEAKQRLSVAVIPAVTENKDFRRLLYAMQKFDNEAFERFSNAILTHVAQGNSFSGAYSNEYNLYTDMINSGLTAASDEILVGMSIYYRDFFNAIPRDRPITCSRHLIGQSYGPPDKKSAQIYYAMYTALFSMVSSSPGESTKSLATPDEALSFAENIWGAEMFDRIVDGTASSAEVCEGFADLYGSILTDNAEKSGGLMRRWMNPAQILEHARKS